MPGVTTVPAFDVAQLRRAIEALLVEGRMTGPRKFAA
jgi:hypothetical protein